MDAIGIRENSSSREELDWELANDREKCAPVEFSRWLLLPNQSLWHDILRQSAHYVLIAQVACAEVVIDDWSIHDVQNKLQPLIVEDQHLPRLAGKRCLQNLEHHQVYLWVRRVFEQPLQHQGDVFAHIFALVLQVPAEELVDIVSILGECAVKVHVSEDEAHVEQAEVLAEDVVGHMRCDKRTLQSLLAYMAPDLHVLVRNHTIIDHK